MSKKQSGLTNRSGVTILEILIVLAIIALIAGVAGPRLLSYLDRAKSETAALQIQQIENALQLFYIDTGRYPSAAEGLGVLLQGPAGNASWAGPYLESDAAILDPWGREYVMQSGDGSGLPTLLSYGRDGVSGGSGADADIGG